MMSHLSGTVVSR